ncbi:MAG TPA: hypothetical protein VK968_01110 [Roseimicrobium sp.]|nr:hypothetical protein [Roseimicrobium sp.]
MKSNHGGCQIGGGALALLALWKDPGVDTPRVEKLMEESKKAIIKQFSEGFGDGGMFWEGKGAGGIVTDTALIPAIQAWRVAGGQDFVSPRPNIPAVTMLKVHELMTIGGQAWYLIDKPNSYGTGYFGKSMPGQQRDRDGLSRSAQFAQGFGAVPEKLKPAALWSYNHIVEPDPASRTFDTVSIYPHRPVLALINWPIGVKEQNPAELLPKVHWDTVHQLYSFRNQWTGTEDDCVATLIFGSRDPQPVMVWGKGQKINFGTCPRGKTTHFRPADDGSGTLTVGGMAVGVDYSKASGADALVVVTGKVAPFKSDRVKRVDAAGHTFYVVLLGKAPDPTVDGETITVGGQTIRFDGEQVVFGKMAPPPALPRMGMR